MWALAKDLHERSQNLGYLDSSMMLKLGFSGFPRKQNNRGPSGAHVTCIYCDLSAKINTRKTPHGVKRSWTHLCCGFFFFCVCGRQKSKDPQFEPHDWRRHYVGRYWRSGISCVYLWLWQSGTSVPSAKTSRAFDARACTSSFFVGQSRRIVFWQIQNLTWKNEFNL